MDMKEVRTRPLAFRDAHPFTLGERGARHPFRLGLPHELLAQIEEQAAAEQAAVQPKKWLNEDISLFLLSFSAFFTAFYLFIF